MESKLTDSDYDNIEQTYDALIKPTLDKLFQDRNEFEKALIYDTITDFIWGDYDIKMFNFRDSNVGKP